MGEKDDVENVRDDVMGVVSDQLRKELIKSVDEIIMLKRMRREEMGEIVDIKMKSIKYMI